MKVKELIELLNECNPENKVMIIDEYQDLCEMDKYDIVEERKEVIIG